MAGGERNCWNKSWFGRVGLHSGSVLRFREQLKTRRAMELWYLQFSNGICYTAIKNGVWVVTGTHLFDQYYYFYQYRLKTRLIVVDCGGPLAFCNLVFITTEWLQMSLVIIHAQGTLCNLNYTSLPITHICITKQLCILFVIVNSVLYFGETPLLVLSCWKGGISEGTSITDFHYSALQ